MHVFVFLINGYVMADGVYGHAEHIFVMPSIRVACLL